MFINFSVSRNTFLSILFTGLSIALLHTSPAVGQTICEEDLGGYEVLTNGATTSKKKDVVDEWDEEVVKIRTLKPGVFTITGTGPTSLTSLYDDESTPVLVDDASLGTNLWDVVVPAGDYCLEVATSVGPSADFELEVAFLDVCHLGTLDDHGDRFLCATPLVMSTPESGVISATPIDLDIFSFTLEATDEVLIESTGGTSLNATLYDAGGAAIAVDDDGGTIDMSEELAAGVYYIRVEGAESSGSYDIEVSPAP